jgi:hypothetical protein
VGAVAGPGMAGVEHNDGSGGRRRSVVLGFGATACYGPRRSAGKALRGTGSMMRAGPKPFGCRSPAGDELGGAAFGHVGGGRYGYGERAGRGGGGRGAHREPVEVQRWARGGRTATNRGGDLRRPQVEEDGVAGVVVDLVFGSLAGSREATTVSTVGRSARRGGDGGREVQPRSPMAALGCGCRG